MKNILVLFLVLLSLNIQARQISQLSVGGSVSDGDLFLDVQGYISTGTGITKVTGSQLKTYASGRSYTLPVATSSVLCGVKQGTNVSISGDVTNVPTLGSLSSTPSGTLSATTFLKYGGTTYSYAAPAGCGSAYTACTGLTLTCGVSSVNSLGSAGLRYNSGSGVYAAANSSQIQTPIGANVYDAYNANVINQGNAVIGTGSIVLATSPTLTTSVLGTQTSGNLANSTFPTLNQNSTGSAASFTGLLAGDVTGTQGATVVGKIHGTAIPSANSTALGNAIDVPGGVAPTTVQPFSGATTATIPYIIFDDDYVGDADGQEALEELCALDHNGECKILGAICDVKNQWGAPAISATLIYCGLGHVPVGSYTGSTTYSGSYAIAQTMVSNSILNGLPLAAPQMPTSIPVNNGLTYPQESSTTTYRRIFANLVANPSAHPLYIQASGAASAIYNFYNSAADSISPLTGAQLVAAVNPTFFVEGGSYPSGNTDFNFNLDKTAAQIWITLQAAGITVNYIGDQLGFIPSVNLGLQVPPNSPLGVAYQYQAIYDPMCALVAVRGMAFGGSTYFTRTAGTQAITGSNNTFTAGAGTSGYYSFGTGAGGAGGTVDLMIQSLIAESMNPYQLAQIPLTINCTTTNGNNAETFTDGYVTTGNIQYIDWNFFMKNFTFADQGQACIRVGANSSGSGYNAAIFGWQDLGGASGSSSSVAVMGVSGSPYGVITVDPTGNLIASGNISVKASGYGFVSFKTSAAASFTLALGFNVFTGSTASQTGTMPVPTKAGEVVIIKNQSSVSLTVTSNSGSQIIAANATTASASVTLTSGSDTTLWSDGTNWNQL